MGELMLRDSRVSQWWKMVDELEEVRKKRRGDVHIYPSPPDHEDYHLENFVVGRSAIIKGMPQVVRLHLSPGVINQLDTPFCGGASGVGAMNAHYDYYDALPEPTGFSWPFLYWVSKEYDGIPDKPGTYLRVICKVMQKYGVCRYSLLPIEDAIEKPVITAEMIEDASHYKVKRYFKLDTLAEMKEAYNLGLYIMVGTIVTGNNWSTPDGFLGMPSGFVRGAHATYQWGYDETLEGADHNYAVEYVKYLLGMNSWGEDWGDKGKYYMPEDYLGWEAADIPNFRAFLEAWALEFEYVGDKPPQPIPVDPDPVPDPDPEPPEPEPDPKIYVVVSGSFTNRSNANKRVSELEAKGFTPELQIRVIDGTTFYRVVVGTFDTRGEAGELVDELAQAGFTSFISVQDEVDPPPEPEKPGFFARIWGWLKQLFRRIFKPKELGVMTEMEKKPWYRREDFWTAIGGVLAILLAEFFGVSLSIEAFVGMAVLIVGIIWGTNTLERTAMAYRAEEKLLNLQIKLAEIQFRNTK
jgi:hypothetical protein